MDTHSDLTYVEGLGRASTCVGALTHRPRPMRYVWHHVLPQVCGGTTVSTNLVSLCDSCHYSTHALMYMLRVRTPLGRLGTVQQRALARRGYDAAVAAGTVAKIPDEGGVVVG